MPYTLHGRLRKGKRPAKVHSRGVLEVEERVKYVDLNLSRRKEGSWSHGAQ